MNRTILIVEDLAFTRRIYKDALIKGGYQDILEAADAQTSIELFRNELPDMVLLDIVLPDRMDLSVLEEMLQINPEVKVIICSAVNQAALIKEALKLGAVEYCIKPVGQETLVDMVNRILLDE